MKFYEQFYLIRKINCELINVLDRVKCYEESLSKNKIGFENLEVTVPY